MSEILQKLGIPLNTNTTPSSEVLRQEGEELISDLKRNLDILNKRIPDLSIEQLLGESQKIADNAKKIAMSINNNIDSTNGSDVTGFQKANLVLANIQIKFAQIAMDIIWGELKKRNELNQ